MDAAAYAIHPIVLRNPHASAIERQRCNAQGIWYWQFVLDIKLRYMYSTLSANASAITRVESAFAPSDWMLVVLTEISAANRRLISHVADIFQLPEYVQRLD